MAHLEHNFQWHSYQFNNFAPATSISTTGSPFLTPPQPARYSERPPFKISSSDNTSLSLKRRHHPIHHEISYMEDNTLRSGAATGPDKSPVIQHRKLNRSRSLPCLPDRKLACGRRSIFTSAQREGSSILTIGRRRGWTMPAKALSTRGVSNLRPVFKHHGNISGIRSELTPAVITLKRATTSASRSTNITFFPPPKFERTRSGLISAFLNTIAGDGSRSRAIPAHNSENQDSRTRNDVGEITHFAGGDAAKPAVTKIMVEPVILDVNNNDTPFRRRRCSTIYVAGSSVHEIIWDENDTPSSSSDHSSIAGVVQSSQNRRSSVAVAQLETRLAKAIPQSRNIIPTSEYAPQHGTTTRDLYGWSFPEMLDRCLSRLTNDTALRNLPRSKASKQQPRAISSVVSGPNVHQTLDEPEGTSPDHASKWPSFPIHQPGVSRFRDEEITAGDFRTEFQVDARAARPIFDMMHPPQSRAQVTKKRHGFDRDSSATKLSDQAGLVSGSADSETVPLLHTANWHEYGP